MALHLTNHLRAIFKAWCVSDVNRVCICSYGSGFRFGILCSCSFECLYTPEVFHLNWVLFRSFLTAADESKQIPRALTFYVLYDDSDGDEWFFLEFTFVPVISDIVESTEQEEQIKNPCLTSNT